MKKFFIAFQLSIFAALGVLLGVGADAIAKDAREKERIHMVMSTSIVGLGEIDVRQTDL